MHLIASFLYILMWKVLWMEIRIVLVWFPYYKSVKNKWKDRQIDIRLQLLMHNKIWKKCVPMYCMNVGILFIISCGKWLPLAYLRKSGARTIMCWKSSSDRRPSLSRSASSITFSLTILTSSSVSSLRVSLFNVFSRSDLQMKSSLLKSCRKWKRRRWLIDWLIDWLVIQTVKHLFW